MFIMRGYFYRSGWSGHGLVFGRYFAYYNIVLHHTHLTDNITVIFYS